MPRLLSIGVEEAGEGEVVGDGFEGGADFVEGDGEDVDRSEDEPSFRSLDAFCASSVGVDSIEDKTGVLG